MGNLPASRFTGLDPQTLHQETPAQVLAHSAEPLPSTIHHIHKRKADEEAKAPQKEGQRAEGQQAAAPQEGKDAAASSSSSAAAPAAAEGAHDEHIADMMDRLALAQLINEAMPIDRARPAVAEQGHAEAHKGRRGQLVYPTWMYDHTIDLTLEFPGITVRQVRAELARDLWRRAKEHYGIRSPTDQQLHDFVHTGRIGMHHKKQKTDEEQDGQHAQQQQHQHRGQQNAEEEQRSSPLSGLLPSETTLRDWMADAPYHLSHRAPLLALQNAQPVIHARQNFMRGLIDLWKIQPPHEVITIDERSLVLYPTPHGMRVKEATYLFTRHPTVQEPGRAAAPPPNAVEPLPFELAPNLWKQPLSSIIAAIERHDNAADLAAAVPEAGEHLQHRRHVLHVVLAVSRSRVVMAMTQLRPFTPEDAQIFVQHLLRELDAQEDPHHRKRMWFVWNSACMQPSVRRLFPADGSRQLMELPPHSEFLNMVEDAWGYVSSLVAQQVEQHKGHMNATVVNEYVKHGISLIQPQQLHNWYQKVLCFVNDCAEGNAIDSHRPVEIPAENKDHMPAEAKKHPWPILSLRLYRPEVERELTMA